MLTVRVGDDVSVDPEGIVEKDYRHGTGFYISTDGLLVTAAHVVSGASTLVGTPISCCEPISGESAGVTVLFADEDADIAVLQNPLYSGSRRNDHYVNLSEASRFVGRGMECICIGFPTELRQFAGIYSLSVGKTLDAPANLAGFLKIPWRRRLLPTSCQVTAGFSGGLVLDMSMKPIGMILATAEGEGPTAFVRMATDIVKTLEERHLLVR